MGSSKLLPGESFPIVNLPLVGWETVNVGRPQGEGAWQLAVVYRGKHCPLCERYLATLNTLRTNLEAINIEPIIVSADPGTKAALQVAEGNLTIPCAYDLSVEQMRKLGLYISQPRSATETDRPFAEPGIFVVNDKGVLLVTDISNAPFSRPDLELIVRGLTRMREAGSKVAIRGTL